MCAIRRPVGASVRYIVNLLSVLVMGSGLLWAAPFAEKVPFTQPDGTAIELWGQGDEFYAVFESLDGYTVVFDQTVKAYCYARLSADASQLLPTGVQVQTGNPQTLGLTKHLRISPVAVKRQVAERFARWDAGMEVSQRWNDLKAAALAEAGAAEYAPPSQTTLGTKVGLCLLIDFDDDPATVAQAEIVNFCNGDNYTGYGNNGSVKKYFQDNANNLLTYSNVVTIYIRIPNSLHPKSYYNDTTQDCGDQANLLIKDALDVMKALPNYDTEILPTFNALTVDANNRVVACNVFYAGGNGGVWAMGLWPHSWALVNVGEQELSSGGKKVYRYQVTNIGSSLRIGTFCHENGHMLCGFPDIYDYDYDSVGGAGIFCLMDYGGSGANPVQVCAYLKRAAGWAMTTELSSSSALVATVTATAGTNFNHFYRYQKPGVSTEYFLVECRYKAGRDANLPASGVAIWHIDELGDRDDQRMTPNTLHHNYEVTLVQADNQWHFQNNVNSGDAYDPYYNGNSSTGYSNVFSDASAPDAHWWSGANSGVNFHHFTVQGTNMMFGVGTVATVPVITTQPSSQTVPVGTNVTFTVVASGMAPLRYQWRKGGGSIAVATDASYSIVNAQTNDTGNYSVVVSNFYGSVTSSNATLTVVPTISLADALDTSGLTWTTDGDAGWFGQTNTTHDLADAAQSGGIMDGQQSRMRTVVSGPGTLTFWWKVSSQSGADLMRLFVNSLEQTNVSGEVDWRQETVFLPAGTVTLEWTYCKDGSVSAGQDKAWVDQVVFTTGATPPNIVTQPAGQNVFMGTSAAFNVSAYGTPPLSYQWRFGGNNILGATAPSFAVTSAGPTNAGVYSVLVTNAYGSAISSNAVLAVVPVAAWGDNSLGQINVLPGSVDVVAIAAGAWHSLSLRADGTVLAWGYNWNGQSDVPPTLKNAVAIAGGGYHSLALKADRTVVAWGADYYGEATVAPDLTNVIALAAGTWHSLALRANGTVVAWGDSTWGQTNVPSGLTNVVAVASGGNHSLALKSDGTVVAWGENTDAQGNYAGQSVVPWNLTNAVAIAAGEYHSLALKSDGTVVAWGDNSQGQASPPTGLAGVIGIAGGGAHGLALKDDGMVVAWGNNWNGQCNVPAGLTNALAIAAGSYHSLALLDDGTLVLRLFNLARNGSQFSALLRTRNGKNYVLEYKNSLTATNWTALPAAVGNGALRFLIDPSATTPRRFYRVRQR